MIHGAISHSVHVLTLLVVFAPTVAAQQVPAQVPATERQMPRVFLDCDRCDGDYIRKEVTFVDYVRTREDADVHVLVTVRDSGGGREWTLKFDNPRFGGG
jgi:hypothetical protein